MNITTGNDIIINITIIKTGKKFDSLWFPKTMTSSNKIISPVCHILAKVLHF